MTTQTTLESLLKTAREMTKDLNNIVMTEDRQEEIHDFYVQYSSISLSPSFDDAIVKLETAYQRFESIGTIEDSK